MRALRTLLILPMVSACCMAAGTLWRILHLFAGLGWSIPLCGCFMAVLNDYEWLT